MVVRKMRRVHHKLRRDEVSEVGSYRLCLEDRRGPSEALVDFVFALADAKQVRLCRERGILGVTSCMHACMHACNARMCMGFAFNGCM